MLVYEKGVGEERHLYGTMANIPSDEDVQLSFKDADGNPVEGLTLTETYLDNGHGGIIRKSDSEPLTVFIGENNIIPGPAIFEKTPTGIEITTEPTKMTYSVGDTLDLSGMVVKLFYNDGSSEEIEDWEADPDTGDILAKDDTPVMITYNEFYDELNIDIQDVPKQPEEPAE